MRKKRFPRAEAQISVRKSCQRLGDSSNGMLSCKGRRKTQKNRNELAEAEREILVCVRSGARIAKVLKIKNKGS